MKKLLLSLLLALLTATGLQAQCSANFTMALNTTTPYPYDAIFTNTSTPSAGPIFYWYFYGGAVPASVINTGFSTSPSVSFPGPGTYSVVLDLHDTSSNCYDSLYTNITIPGTALGCITWSTATSCGLCDGSASVNATGGTAPYTYLWSNGATSDSISNLCAGTFTVTITDAFNLTTTCTAVVGNSSGLNLNLNANNSQPCLGDTAIINANASGSSGYSYNWSNGSTSSSIAVTVAGTYACTVTDVNGCFVIDSINISNAPVANLNMSATNETCASCCDGTASASISGGGMGYVYLWSNGSTSSSITSLCPGTYTVSVTDNLYGCVVSSSVTVSASSGCYTIGGNVDQAGAGDTRVYLIEENNNVLSALDSTITDSLGNYAFSNICAGTYYVKAALLPSSAVYASYLPTYYNAALLWSNATALVISNASMNNINIIMASGTNTGGPGFVGGSISQGANSNENNPVRGGRNILANLPFILTDMNDELVAFTYSDENGAFTMEDIALGNYKLFIDYLNKVSYPLTFELTAENPSITNADFLLNAEDIKPINPTGIETIGLTKAAVVFPNPANGYVEVKASENIEEIKLLSVDGRLIVNQNINNSQVSIDLSAYKRGTYIMQIKLNEQIEHHILIVE